MPSAASDPSNPALHVSNLITFQTLMANEREYQVKKWGDTFDQRNTPNDWIAYVTSYAGMAVTMPFNAEEFKKRMVQVATICAAAFDFCERNAGNMAARHYDENATDPSEPRNEV